MPQGHTEKMLSPVRRAIHGWAFCDRQMLHARIKQGELARDKLAPTLREQADSLIAPLRNAIQRMRA